MTDEFKEYGKQVVKNAKAFANEFIKRGYKVISNGTENHMFVLDTYTSKGLTGKQVEEFLDKINITLNKNQIPNDTLPPLKSSGVRIGTPAMTTKGWKENDFIDLAILIDGFLINLQNKLVDDSVIEIFKKQVKNLIERVGNK